MEMSIALLVLATIMAAIPYTSLIKSFFITLFGTRPPSIAFFSYSLSGEEQPPLSVRMQESRSPDHQNDYLIEGTRILFRWKVAGARRVDLIPVGHDLRGDSANAIIQSCHTRYVLRVYGFFGKVEEAVIEFPNTRFRRIDTRPFTSDVHLMRELPSIGTVRFLSLIHI